MSTHILKLLSFRITGRFGHFRKFYTNSSSLSYFLPPRTAIAGMLASILKYDRDTYYETFHPDNFKIGVSVTPGTSIKKQMQSINYLHEKYYKLLNTGNGSVMHSQCKLEMLVSNTSGLDYTVYIGACNKQALNVLDELGAKIQKRDFGFGVYLGQRQFRSEIDHLRVTEGTSITFLKESEYVDSLCMQKNAEPYLNYHSDLHIIVDQMPIHMQIAPIGKKGKKKADPGRILEDAGRVMYEKSGKRIPGKFKNCYQIGDKVISFYEL